DVDAVEAGPRPEDVDRVAERHDRERRDRGEDRDHGREREQPGDRGARAELLLGRELHDLGQRLEDPERADAVRAVAVLEAAEDLALGDDHHREDLQADEEDHDRLEDLHPPRLDVGDVGEWEGDGHALRTSTSGPSSADAESSGIAFWRNTLPGGIAARSATVPCTLEPFEPTTTRSPSSTPRRCASAGESSTCWRGCRKRSAGEAWTSGAAQTERNVPSRKRPSASAALAGGGSSSNGPRSTSKPKPAACSRSCQRTPLPPISSCVIPA